MKWVVTSAWPYSSDIPHLGNMIGSTLSADVFARYLRMTENEVVYVSGSDEHGTPVEVEAMKRKMPVRELADINHERISDIFRRWNISFDNYTRTDSETHWRLTRELYMDIYNNDSYIFTQTERINYCTFDKRFLPDRFVEGTCPYCGYERARGDQCDNCGRLMDADKLIHPYCVICGRPTELRETKQWFFDLPKMSTYISDYLTRAELSSNVISFCRGWMKDGLRPRSLTRDSKWGIKAPFPGAEDKTIYVWMDAVLGYVSAVIEYFEKRPGEEERWKEFWLDPSAKTSFFIGKDNIPFHAIILPSLLKASGKSYNEPNMISSTEFLNFEGQKFSKSRKIGIWTDEALEILPADYWRFYLVSIRPEEGDTNFKWDVLVEKVNSDLNDTIGNFVNRTLVGVQRFSENRFDLKPKELPADFQDSLDEALTRHQEISELFGRAKLQAACRKVTEQGYVANRFLSNTEPWKVVKQDKPRALEIFYVALSIMKILTSELYPIVPDSSLKITAQSGLFSKTKGVPVWSDVSIEGDLPIITKDVQPIFTKVNSMELQASLNNLRERNEVRLA
jgi:methionyl-tRNA synthetase